jgi:hypothetical protein
MKERILGELKHMALERKRYMRRSYWKFSPAKHLPTYRKMPGEYIVPSCTTTAVLP